MAFPTYESTTVTDFTSDATSHNANMPATVNAGDLLLAFAAFDGASTTITTPSGWTRILDPGTTDPICGVYAKVADGTEDSTTVDFATSNTQMGSVHVVRVSSWNGALSGLRAAGGRAQSSTTGIALYVGASADVLWVLAHAKSTSGTFGTLPTGYSNENKSNASQDVSSRAAIATATRTNAAASEAVNPLWANSLVSAGMLVAVLPA